MANGCGTLVGALSCSTRFRKLCNVWPIFNRSGIAGFDNT